ncbi:MAG: hypothetical protein KKE73_10845 [Proteobacteria bacterium]|nr:hypothetical protein [Pseudomonadota bacterium]
MRKPRFKNRKKQNKAKNQQYYARCRALERYGIELTHALHDKLVQQIQSGEAKLVAVQSKRVRLYRVRCGGQRPVVVYDRERGNIVTFLTEEMAA